MTKLAWTVVLIVVLQANSLGSAFACGSNTIQVCRPWPWASLKGAKPVDLPVELARKFDLTSNLKTAKMLGIPFPRAILLRADEVIE